jgi:6-phosphofructokinase 2
MSLPSIVTLTLNPTVDAACEAELVRPIHKIRTSNEEFGPGGGGINVARTLRDLGGDAVALYLAGGATGGVLGKLTAAIGLPCRPIAIGDDTRIAHIVYERSSGLEYRFVPEGPRVTEDEWRKCLTAVAGLSCDYFIASGSLPRGLPADAYVQVAARLPPATKFVLDTSGAALARAVDRGGLFLVKPSRGEFETLVGRRLQRDQDIGEAAMGFVRSGAAQYVAVTLGRDGALLASADGVLRRAAPDVVAKSAVGAGDSFLAALVLALAGGRPADDAFAYALAAGAAAVLRHGPYRCDREDVARLYGEIRAGAVEKALFREDG